jgi:hypothetical protein
MIFKQFESTDIVAGRSQPVSTGMWSDGEIEWSQFYTSSVQTVPSSSQFDPLNGLYYTNVYDYPIASASADIYFSLTFGHYAGSGSSTFDTNTSQGSLIYPTKAIYNQYRNLLLAPGDTKFSFAQSDVDGNQTYVDSDAIYAISFRSTKYKDRLDPGQFELTLSGSLGKITLIDDSRYNTETTTQTGGKRYNIIRGTIAGGASQTSRNYEAIGSMYPDLGIVLLNPTALNSLVGTVDGRSLYDPVNGLSGQFAIMQNVLFRSIQLGATYKSMKARATEYVPARHYFVRVKNQEYNYSNNPTFIISDPSSSDYGKLRFTDFYTDPKVYITTVGLYNESNDLVAVAKLSQPLLKDFTNECLIKIKIDI